MLKKLIILQLSKIKVSHSIPGRIRLKVNSLKMMPKEYMVYEKFLNEALNKLKGITSVEVNNITGSILISYDVSTTYEKKVLRWIEKIKEIGIRNIDLIEKYGETNLEFVVKTINQQLEEDLKKL